MTTYKTCVFCDRNDSRPSREDILARWIAREFENIEWEVTNVETQKTFKTVGKLGLISKKPCERCNNGWMAKLEAAAKPILIPLMDGENKQLTTEQQHLIVAWLIKIVILYELLSERIAYFQASERHGLMKSLSIPDGILVFLARYYGPTPISTTETPVPLIIRSENKPEDSVSAQGYSVTIVIKQLALQVFVLNKPKELLTSRVNVKIGRGWNDFTVQLWPIIGDASWPPRYTLTNDHQLDRFTNRWSNV